jgi:hypothetical protein
VLGGGVCVVGLLACDRGVYECACYVGWGVVRVEVGGGGDYGARKTRG